MAQRMTGDRHPFPTAVSFRLRFETGFFSKAAQQSIRIESQEIRGVARHRILERSVEQAHIFETKLLRLALYAICYLRGILTQRRKGAKEDPERKKQLCPFAPLREKLFHDSPSA
jgi:hypothetical protein